MCGRIAGLFEKVRAEQMLGKFFNRRHELVDRDIDRDLGLRRILGIEGQRAGRITEDAAIVAEAEMVDGEGDLAVCRIDRIGARGNPARIGCAGRAVLGDRGNGDSEHQSGEQQPGAVHFRLPT